MNIWDVLKVLTYSVVIGAFCITSPLYAFFDVDFTWFIFIVSTIGGFFITLGLQELYKLFKK